MLHFPAHLCSMAVLSHYSLIRLHVSRYIKTLNHKIAGVDPRTLDPLAGTLFVQQEALQGTYTICYRLTSTDLRITDHLCTWIS